MHPRYFLASAILGLAISPAAQAVNANVGIGTSSPYSKLHLFHGTNIDPSVTYHSANAWSLDSAGVELVGGVLTAGPWTYWMQARSWSNAAMPLAINPLGGNVGIGTTAPNASLDIGGNPSNAIRTAYLNISGANVAASDRPYFRGMTNHLVINGGGTSAGGDVYLNYTGDGATGNVRVRENLFVMATGFVGIGTAGPSHKLDVYGPSNDWTVVGYGGYGVLGETTQAGGQGVQGYNTANGSIGVLAYGQHGAYGYGVGGGWGVIGSGDGSSHGVLGVVNWSGGAGVLGQNYNTGTYSYLGYSTWGIFCGTGTCGGSAAWTVSSDRRMKRDIHPISSALEKINALEGVYFRWKDKKRDEREGPSLGLIAQNVETVFPEVVKTETDVPNALPGGTKMVSYDLLVAPLVEAMKELSGKVANLQQKHDAEVAVLRSTIQQLQRELATTRAEISEPAQASSSSVGADR